MWQPTVGQLIVAILSSDNCVPPTNFYMYITVKKVQPKERKQASKEMAEEETKKSEQESTTSETQAGTPAVEALKNVAEEKSVISPPPPAAEEKFDDPKALAIVETKVTETVEDKNSEGSVNRDAVLARVATEKRMSLIRAWEESEKSKAENKAQKKLSAILSWENSQKANVEAELKRFEENLENKKADYVEKMKNKVALVHKSAEEKKAKIEAKKSEDLLKAEEMAAKYRATGTSPKKLLGWF